MTENPNVDKKTEAEVSPALTNALSDHLRLTAEKADLTVLCKVRLQQFSFISSQPTGWKMIKVLLMCVCVMQCSLK